MTADFDEWLRSVAYPALGEIESDDHWTAWLEGVFRTAGPVDEGALWDLRDRHRVALADRAVTLLRRDVSAGLEPAPVLEVEVSGSSVEFACDGETSPHYAGGLLGITFDVVALEAADCVQDVLALDRHVLWPWCSTHGTRLGPELNKGVPIWECAKGGHVVADIGLLTAEVSSY